MQRVEVDSGTIATIGYDSRKLQLEIEFRKSGTVYLYSEVPPEEHTAFMEAESNGKYLNEVFKARNYPYTVVHSRRK